MLTAVISIMDKSLKAPNLCKIKMSKKKTKYEVSRKLSRLTQINDISDQHHSKMWPFDNKKKKLLTNQKVI